MKMSKHTLVSLSLFAFFIGASTLAHADAVVQGANYAYLDYTNLSTSRSYYYNSDVNIGPPTSDTVVWSDTCSTCSGYGVSGSGSAKVVNGSLGANSSISVTGSPDALFYAEANSYAQYTDSLTINGGTGSGVLTLNYSIDGSISQTGSGYNASYAYLGIFLASGVEYQTNNYGLQSGIADYFTAGNGTYSGETVTFYIPFTYGDVFSIEPILRSTADFYTAFDSTPFTSTVDFYNTATLDSALVYAGTPENLGTLNTGAGISSTNGLIYGPNGITTVPEPGTLALLGAGFLGLVVRRRCKAKV